MKIGTPRPRASAVIDMVPMINFAFLLLIFVILAGVIAAPDVLPVQPPRSAAQARQAIVDTVIVDAQGRIAFGGEVLQPDVLLVRVQAWRKAGGERPLIVKADAAADAQRVVGVLEVLRAAGVQHASLLTTRRSG